MTDFTIDDITKMITAIRGDNHNEKKYALSNLHTIAKALGPDRTRDELLPYTMEATNYDEEEYGKIAEELGRLLPFINGENEISILLQPLRYICENEDEDVRMHAVDGIVSLTKSSSKPTRIQKIYPLIEEMAIDNWYASRCSAAAIICRSFYLYPESCFDGFFKIFNTLVNDTNLVSKTLAAEFPSLIQTQIQQTKHFQSIKKLLSLMSQIQIPAVAIQIPLSISTFTQVFPNELPYAIELSQSLLSGPWQAHAAFLDALPSIFRTNSEINNDVKIFIKENINQSISETQIEVRIAAIRLIPYLYELKCFDSDEFSILINTLISDRSETIREATAKALGCMTMKDPPLPLLEASLSKLMKDVIVGVKVAALTAIATTGAGVQSANHAFDLVKFASWRTKKAIATALRIVCRKVNSSDFDSGFLSLLIMLLSDEAADVRKEAIEVVSDLNKAYGKEWRDRSIVPTVIKFAENNDYLIREVAAWLIVKLDLLEKCQNVLQNLLDDKVPNVRMILARELPNGSTFLDKLKTDADSDVAFFAQNK